MLTDYHEILIDNIVQHFGDSLDSVEAYFPADTENTEESGMAINTPAALVAVDMLEDGEDPGDDRDGIVCNVSIHCVLSTLTPNLDIELRNFAAEMMRSIKRNSFGGVCEGKAERPEGITAVPGRFEGGKNGYDSFVVSFTQTVFLGERWTGVEISPQKVFFGRYPANGIDNISDYEQVV